MEVVHNVLHVLMYPVSTYGGYTGSPAKNLICQVPETDNIVDV